MLIFFFVVAPFFFLLLIYSGELRFVALIFRFTLETFKLQGIGDTCNKAFFAVRMSDSIQVAAWLTDEMFNFEVLLESEQDDRGIVACADGSKESSEDDECCCEDNSVEVVASVGGGVEFAVVAIAKSGEEDVTGLDGVDEATFGFSISPPRYLDHRTTNTHDQELHPYLRDRYLLRERR